MEEAGGDLGGLRPGWIQCGIVGSVAIQVGECFSGDPKFYLRWHRRYGSNPAPLPFCCPCCGVVICVIGVGDRVPDFLNGRVGADNHLVAGTADGVSVVGWEGEYALWGFRIVVESLGEGVVERRGFEGASRLCR